MISPVRWHVYRTTRPRRGTEQQGEIICELHDPPNISGIVFKAGQTMDLDFGLDGKGFNEPVTYDWTYSNLRLELVP